MSERKTFGWYVREARVSRGLTLEAVAKAIDSHKGYVSGIEHGKVNPPSWKITRKLCRILRLKEREMQLLGWIEKAPAIIREEAYARIFGPALELDMRAKTPLVTKPVNPSTDNTGESARALDGTGLVERPSDHASLTEAP